MKKLVCEKDIQKLVSEGKKVCYVTEDTLVTPSAKDAARTAGIEISCGEEPKGCCSAPAAAPAACAAPAAAPAAAEVPGEISSDVVYQLLKTLADKGLLGDLFASAGVSPDAPYACEQDVSGLKVVRGNTVRMDEFFEGNPRVTYQELIDKNSSNISSGLLIIDHDTYEWTQNYDENDYVIEGDFVVTINGRSYTAHAGDCIFIPNGATVVMGSKDCCCKVFYNTYPSNWADLMEG
jgi:ethanolamine utilization protein EutQ